MADYCVAARARNSARELRWIVTRDRIQNYMVSLVAGTPHFGLTEQEGLTVNVVNGSIESPLSTGLRTLFVGLTGSLETLTSWRPPELTCG
jgi:hypothetical protein